MPNRHPPIPSPPKIKIALAGNPNSGKTTIFNNLTGLRQHVGNYPGVTVEIKEGDLVAGGVNFHIVDLPGIYSLTAHSAEELVARNYILEQKPEVLVDVVDASNIERNLYLATQFMELDVPIVLALNMADVAKTRGIEFDLEKLSNLLGIRIVPTVGHRKQGMDRLLAAVREAVSQPDNARRVTVSYGQDIEDQLEKVQHLLERDESLCRHYGARWLAIKLLEGDSDVWEKVTDDEVRQAARKAAERIESLFGESVETIMADRRYGFISGACQEAVRVTVETRHTMSDKVDEVLTSSALGLPILLAMMYLVFYMTFTFGDPPMQWIEAGFGYLGGWLGSLWPPGSESLLKSLLIDGIIGGVGLVIVFLPNILLLFLGIAVLEDSGYMARAAFIMDNLMHRIGLHGKSFIPLLVGFGCTVPAIMATRILESRRDRLLTMLIAPLMSCGARLTIYTMIIPAFFPQAWRAPVLWIIYIIGVLAAILFAKLLNKSVLKGRSEPFVMELPPYRLPTARSVFIHMWERGWLYLKNAGTLILGAALLLWALSAFPVKKKYDFDYAAQKTQQELLLGKGITVTAEKLGLSATGSDLLPGALETGSPPPAEPAGPGERQVIKDFLDMLSRVQQAREHLETRDLGPVTHKVMETHLAAVLAGLDENEHALYSAAVFYLDKVRGPFDLQIADIDKHMHAERLGYSAVGRLGHVLEKVLSPLGFDWKISTALIGAFMAKEVFVAQMGILYSVEETAGGIGSLRSMLQRDYSPLTAVCIMIFCLLGTPCMATVAITRRESGAWGWALLQWGGLTAMAYIVTLVVYQAGTFLRLGLGG